MANVHFGDSLPIGDPTRTGAKVAAQSKPLGVPPVPAKPVTVSLPSTETQVLAEWNERAFADEVAALPPGFEGRVRIGGMDLSNVYARIPPGTTRASELKVFYVEITGPTGGLYGPIDPTQLAAPRQGGAAFF